MKIFRSLSEFAQAHNPDLRTVVTIGNFDGVHRGHTMVIESVRARAEKLGALAVAVTFDPHPVTVLRPERELRQLTPLDEKLRLLEATGLDATLVLRFDDALRQTTARAFAESVLRDAMHAIEVHEGENFRFGHGAEADIASLAQLGHECAFEVRAWNPLVLRGSPVSSSRIRKLIAAGALSQARALLGRSFSVRSTPAHGRGYGSKYTVPTVNLAPYSGLLPENGVYITTLRIGEGAFERTFRGVTNAGNRPTFGADSFAVESFLFDFEPLELTESTPLELTFLARLRAEQRFESPEALKAQILRDVQKAQRFFALCDAGIAHPLR
ncbi:MAG: riboflavin biosynthesis protein RibF [Acidobacteriaceae bacterium]|nr:riboflavin biosynthesis protein RibF [Acidobacteriaceae bacterium]